MARVQRFIFVWTNSCIYFDELVSRNAAVGPYKTQTPGHTFFFHKITQIKIISQIMQPLFSCWIKNLNPQYGGLVHWQPLALQVQIVSLISPEFSVTGN